MVTDVDFALNRGLDLCPGAQLLTLPIPKSSAPRPRPSHSHSPLERMEVTSEFPQSELGPQVATDSLKSQDWEAGVRTRDASCH